MRKVDPAVRCCFMGGAISPEGEGHLLRLGALAVFHKPFRFDQLTDALRALLKGKQG